MKYFTLKPINAALKRIHEGDSTNEHVTGSAISGLLNNYFPVNRFIITPEKIQDFPKKRPDFTVEFFNIDTGEFATRLFVEIKGIKNANFNDILDQLYETILHTVDSAGDNFSVYAIAMKGTKIAFFHFCSYASLLDEYEISNYKGFVPLDQVMHQNTYNSINGEISSQDFVNNYLQKYPRFLDKNTLKDMGVESTSYIDRPCIYDLLNKDHENRVHDLFTTMAKYVPGTDILD